MKIKLDENLPEDLVAVLTGLGHNVDTVRTEQLTGGADPDVRRAAQAAQRFLITRISIFPMSAATRPALTPISFLCA